MDPVTIGGAISSTKAALDIARAMIGLSKDVAVNQKAAELLSAIADTQGKLLEAQEALGQMQDELRRAKEELASRADLDRYELTEPFKGTRIYRLKAAAKKESEPTHYICPTCRDVLRKLSILQEGDYYAACTNKSCGQTFQTAAVPPISFGGDHNPYA